MCRYVHSEEPAMALAVSSTGPAAPAGRDIGTVQAAKHLIGSHATRATAIRHEFSIMPARPA
jgi:hypothetical protein